MGTIPVPDGPSVAPSIPQAEFSARTAPDANGAAIAQGIGDVAGAQQDIYLRHKAAADEIAVQEAQVRATHEAQDLLYNPQTGALNRKGKDAANIPGTLFPEFAKRMSAINAGLTNPTQQRAFAQVQLQQKAQLDTVVQHHIAGEIQAYDEQTTQGVIDAGANTALLNPNMPAMVAMGVDTQRQAIASHAARNGIAPELRDAKIRETVGNTYVGVIGRLVDQGQTAQARDYYAAIKDNIDGHHQALIDNALKVAGTRDDARAIADEILHKTDKEGNPLDEVAMLQELDSRKIKDGELYSRVRDNVVQHVADARQAEQAVQYDLTNQGMQALEDPKNTLGMGGVPPSIVSRLDFPHRKALEERAAQLVRRDAPETNPMFKNIAYQFSATPAQPFTDPVTGEKTSFLQMNFADPIYPLSKADRDAAINKQAEIRKQFNGEQAKLDDPTQHVEEAMRIVLPAVIGKHYHEPTKLTADENGRIDNFRQRLDKEVLAAQKGSTKVLGPMEVQAIARKLVANVEWESPRSSFSPLRLFSSTYTDSAPAFETPVPVAYTLSDVPPAHLESLRKAFDANGAKASDETLLDAYNSRVKALYEAGKLNARP